MSLETSQMQQPADFGSEASFGQENVSRDFPHDPSDISSYLRSLKEKQMAQIDRVFKNHHQRLEDSERELSGSMREIQSLQTSKKREKEEQKAQAERARQEEEHYQKILSVKPQTVEQIKERVRLQMQLQQKAQSQQNISFSQNQINQISQISKSPISNKNLKQSLGTGKSTGKKKGTLWFFENREQAEFEYALREFLKEKIRKKSVVPETPKVFKPIIITPQEKKLYNRMKENEDYEVMTPCSDELSNYAFETGNDILANFQSIFENTEKSFSKSKKKRYRVRDFKDDELFLIAYFFKKIPQHTVEGDEYEEEDYVTKENFEQALLNQREILLLYNIKPEDLQKELLKQSIKKNGFISLKEAGEFLMRDRQSLSMEHYENIQKLKQDGNRETLSIPQSVLTEDQIKIIRDIFLDVDTFGEMKISLKQLIHKIKTDHRTRDWIEKPIAYIKKVDRTILLEDLFSELEQWMSIGKEQERRQKEMVDWDTVQTLFVSYKRKDIPSRDKVFAAQRLLGRYDFGDTIEIPKEFLQILKTTFENLPKYAIYYVNSNDFIEEIINHKQYTFFKTKFVREKKYIDLEIETVDDVMKRMTKECDIYHTQDELLDFFSRKGRPRYLTRRIKHQKNKKIFLRKVEKQEDQEEQENQLEDSFELDRNQLKEKRKQRKVAKILHVSEEDAQKQLDKNKFLHEKQFGAQFKSQDEDYIITVPQPFNFESRDKVKIKSIRQRRLEEMLQDKQDEENYYVSTATAFRANKIPHHIKNKKLWSQIMKKNEQRRLEVKKESKAITLSRENPFSFYYRDLQKVIERKQFEPQYKQTLFKAKHAPWYCRVRLFDRLMERQKEKSRQNVENRKVELMRGSKLPEGVRSMLERLKVKDQITEEKRQNRLNEYTFQPLRAKSVPDFMTLQQQFEDRLRERKQDYEPTVPVPFNFQETRKAPSRDYLDKENVLLKKTKEGGQQEERERKLKKILTMKVKYQPPSTKKYEALVAKKRFEQEMKSYQKEVTQTREQDKNERRKKFAEFVNSCVKNVNYSEYANQLNEQKQIDRENRIMEKMQWEQQFDQKMTEMMQNVIRRPLLIEQVSQSNFTSGRAQRLRQILGEGAPIQEEAEQYEDEDGIYIPNFDQMTEMQLRQYLDPATVDPQILEIRKQVYLQYYQKNGQMPNINEMDEEDEDQYTHQHNQDGYDQEEDDQHDNQQDDGHEDDQEEEEGQQDEGDNEAVNKMNQQYEIQGNYQQYNKEDEHDGGEDEEEDDFQNNEELIEQQKQVQQIQQQQMDDDEDDDYEIDGNPLPAQSSAEDYQKVYSHHDQQSKGKNLSADFKSSSSQQQQSNSLQKVNNQSTSSAKAVPAAPITSQPKSQSGVYPQVQDNQPHDDNEDEDEDYDEDEQLYDENGQPIPAYLVREYQEQLRRMQEEEQYDDEEYDEDDDDDEYDEDAQYYDENGNPIPQEVVMQIKEERRAQKQLKLQQQQMDAMAAQQKSQRQESPQQVDSQKNSQQPSINKGQLPQQQSSTKSEEKPQVNNPIQNIPSAQASVTAVQPSGSASANAEQQKPNEKIDKNQQQLNFDDDEDDDEDQQINEEDLLDNDAEFIDEDGNPLTSEQVALILKHQKMQEMGIQDMDMQDMEDAEYVDEDGNPIPPEEVAEILKHQKMQMEQGYGNQDDEDEDEEHEDDHDGKYGNPDAVQKDREGAYPQEEFEDDEDEEYQYTDQHGNPIDPEQIRQMEKEYKLQQQQEAAEAEAAKKAVSKDKASAIVSADSAPKKPTEKEALKDHDAEQDEYDLEGHEDQEEPQFESEEEYIDYLVQMELRKYKAAGKNVSEEEIRQRIEEQIMMDQQENEQMDEMNEQLEEAIAQMSPDDLAQFVDQNGEPLTKDQIKYILMQQQFEGEYDDEEEYDEEEIQEQMQMREGSKQRGAGQKDAQNSSF